MPAPVRLASRFGLAPHFVRPVRDAYVTRFLSASVSVPCRLRVRPIARLGRSPSSSHTLLNPNISATSYSGVPSMNTGGGGSWVCPGNGSVRARYSWSTLKTGCIGIVAGKSNLYVYGPSTSVIRNGPIFFQSNFLRGRRVFKFLADNQTIWLTSYFGAVARERFAASSYRAWADTVCSRRCS